MNIKESINKIFINVLKRRATQEDFVNYSENLFKKKITSSDIESDLKHSYEYKCLNTIVDNEHVKRLNDLYNTYLNRNLDKSARMYLCKLQLKALTYDEITKELQNSNEYKFKQTRIKNEKLYKQFCNDIRQTIVSKNYIIKNEHNLISDFCIVIIEGRKDSYIDICTYITMHQFNSKTPLYVFCTYNNYLNIKRSLYKFKLNIEYIMLNAMDSVEHYNSFLLSNELWNFLKKKSHKSVLLYQSDSFITKDISQYIQHVHEGHYDIIGAPHIYEDDTYILNGGLSLRNIDSMIKTIQNNESCIIYEPYIEAEDEFYCQYSKISPLELSLKFSFETNNVKANHNEVHGFHCFWRTNEHELCKQIIENLKERFLCSDTKHYELLNNLYKTLLKRNIDDDGLKIYSKIYNKERNLKNIEKEIIKSTEYIKLKEMTKAPEIIPQYKNKSKCNKFNVVICRYNENIDFLKHFKMYPCHVYIYNKSGEKLKNHFENVTIIDIENIAFEDYAYLYHIIENYDNLKLPTLFMQCSLDHVPRFFKYLDDFEKFSDFESLSENSGTQPNNEILKVRYGQRFVTNDLDYTLLKSTLNVSFNDIKTFIEQRYKFKIFNNSTFSPGAYVYVNNLYLIQYKLEYYKNVLDDIKYIHENNKKCSKLYAEILERYFWSSVWCRI